MSKKTDFIVTDTNTLVVEEELPGILVATTDSNYEIASTFARLAEFYESPFEEIRGRYFTLDEMHDANTIGKSNFSYYADYSGFNVPGTVVSEFFSKFSGNLREKEKRLYAGIINRGYSINRNDFYLLGVCNECENIPKYSSKYHEFAHGFFYLDSTYRSKMLRLANGLDSDLKNEMITVLKDWDYDESVIDDEIQAYLATSGMKFLLDTMELKNITSDIIMPFEAMFNKKFRQEDSSGFEDYVEMMKKVDWGWGFRKRVQRGLNIVFQSSTDSLEMAKI